MSEPQGSLIYLMRLLEGHLSASEDAAARGRLEAPDWQNAWQRLQLAAVETTLPVTTWEEPSVPAETLAAFLEGNLSLDEAARIEQDCWNSPELLRELIGTYRFLHVDAPREATTATQPSLGATDRVLALFPEAGGAVDDHPAPAAPRRKSVVPNPQWAETGNRETGNRETGNRETGNRETGNRGIGNGPPIEEPAAGLPVVVNAGKRTTRRRRRTPVWLVYAATIVIGLGLGVGAVLMITLSQGRSERDIVTPSQGQEPPVPLENGQDPPDTGPLQPGTNPPTSPAPQLPSPSIDIVQDDPSRPVDSNPIPPRPRPSPTAVVDRPSDQQYRSLAVQWEQIDGLLVARDNDQQPWHGPHADVHNNTASTYATLTDSWASAKTNHGRIVLGGDTEVQLNGTRDSIQMNVARGKVAISEIPAQENVHLKVGPKSWIIKPVEEDTAIGFTVFARQSQLIVRRGKVAIAGTEIGAGRQVTLGDDGLDKAARISASTRWFSRPEKSLKVPAATRDALLASRNVRADLAAILRTADHPARLLAARWSLTIGTERTLGLALSATDDKLRFAALQWLLSCSPDDPRVHLALRTLARQTNDTQMVRNVLSWLKSAQAKRKVTRDDALRMIQGLSSNHLAIRQISVFFLETAFGKRVVFDPKAGPAARQQAVREWTMFLNRVDRASRVNA